MSVVLSELKVRYLDGDKWELLENFDYYSDVLKNSGRVPKGFVTDFNSIPFGLWNLLPPTEYGEAAVIHDYLYAHNGVDRKTADRVHQEFVKWRNDKNEREGKDVDRWKENVMYWGLRMGGWKPWRSYRKREKPNKS